MTEEEKNELESKTIEEIKKLKRKKPVLLVGKNKELIQNAIKEIYYTQSACLVIPLPDPFSNSDDLITYFGSSGKDELREYSCIGKTETEIEHALFSPKKLIQYYKNGDTFVVRGLNIPRILERLADSVEEYCNGVLIINVPSMDIVPQEILGQFEIIELEPEKKSETTGKKTLRGQKQPYVNQNEFNDFMKKIIEENPESSSLQIARKAKNIMKKENRFLGNNGEPLYKETTLKNIICELKKGLKHTKPSLSKLKNDGKITVKKRHLKSDVKS